MDPNYEAKILFVQAQVRKYLHRKHNKQDPTHKYPTSPTVAS